MSFSSHPTTCSFCSSFCERHFLLAKGHGSPELWILVDILWDTGHWELYISGYQAVFIPCCGMRLSDFSSVWSFRSLGFSLARTNPEMLYSHYQGWTPSDHVLIHYSIAPILQLEMCCSQFYMSSENFHPSSLYFFPFPFLLTLSSQFPTCRLQPLWRI